MLNSSQVTELYSNLVCFHSKHEGIALRACWEQKKQGGYHVDLESFLGHATLCAHMIKLVVSTYVVGFLLLTFVLQASLFAEVSSPSH